MKNEKKVKEPSIIIRPIGRFGGLDNLHVTLAIVVALLFILLLVVSYGKPVIIIANNTTGSCPNSTATGNCTAIHSAAQIKLVAERLLASYSGINSSLSLLPYISNVSSMNLSYLPESKSWYVSLEAKNLANGVAFKLGFLINDMNTSQLTPFLQTVRPSKLSNNSVVASGVVQLGGKYACITQAPTDVYWFIDPYAFGSVQSLLNASEIRQLYGNRVNLTVKIILGDDTQRIGSSVGLFNAAYLSKYVLCASQQRNFSAFTARLNSAYNSSYLSQSVLAGISNSSKLDYAQLNQCLASSSTEINVQSLLAQYYNITQTPIAIVNCHYLALPQTVRQALCYTNSTLC